MGVKQNTGWQDARAKEFFNSQLSKSDSNFRGRNLLKIRGEICCGRRNSQIVFAKRGKFPGNLIQ